MRQPLASRSVSFTVDQLLDESSWFVQLDATARERVRSTIVVRHLGVNQALGRYGERQVHWFGVLEGLLKWCVNTEAGRTVTLGGQLAGSWFGEGTLIRGKPRSADIVALRPTRVALLPEEVFNWLRETNPCFAQFLLAHISERMHWFMGNLVVHRMLDAERMVLRALLGLVHPLLNPRRVQDVTISQEELANLAAVSRQRCNMTLVKLKREGVIDLEYGVIHILDIQALQDQFPGDL